MKLLIFSLIVLLGFTGPIFASGPYDGIWYFSPYGYATVTERDGTLIIVTTYTQEYGGDWSAAQGVRINNTARMTQIVGPGEIVYDIVLEADAFAKVTQISCTPTEGYYCFFPNGHTIYATKVW